MRMFSRVMIMAYKDKTNLTRMKMPQSGVMNVDYADMYEDWIISLALKRFTWHNLPDTCDQRYLELMLLSGFATIAKLDDDKSNPLLSLGVMYDTIDWNCYGDPVSWTAVGYMPQNVQFRCTDDNGVFIRNTDSPINPCFGVRIYAEQLARMRRLIDLNLMHQSTPYLITTPREKRLDAINTVKQIAGYEPFIVATPDYVDNVNFSAINTQVSYIANDIQTTITNTWAEVYRYLGIEHVYMEKKAQMTSEETTTSNYPADLRLLDFLDARNRAAEKVNKKFGTNIYVTFNEREFDGSNNECFSENKSME